MMPPLPRPGRVLACFLAVWALAGCGSSGDPVVGCRNVPDLDTNCPPADGVWSPEWKEAHTALPPLPADENLIPVDAPDGAPGYDYLVDRDSISLGSDGVMRYTVVVRSGTGAVNVFHEGMRCETDQVRTYAYASRDGGFRRMEDDWGPVHARGARGYQDHLFERIMCDPDGYAWDPKQARGQLEAQFTAGGVRIERFCGDRGQWCNRYGRTP